MFVSYNHASFYLWWQESLVKHKKSENITTIIVDLFVNMVAYFRLVLLLNNTGLILNHTVLHLERENSYLYTMRITFFNWKLLSWKFSTNIIHFPTNDFSLLENCQLYLIAKYKASNCFKIEAVIQMCSVKIDLLKILQNSQKNAYARVSFLIKLQLTKRLWHRCFPVNIAKLLRNTFLHRTHSVAACNKIRTNSLKSAEFQFQLFFTTLDIMSSLYIVVNTTK